VPAKDFACVRATVEAALGGAALETVFSEFDEAPLAAESIGQVHRATLKSGEKVVVKVMYKEVEGQFRGDIFAAKKFAALALPEHVKALEQPLREACKRVERGVEAVEAEARCLTFAWLCWQALAMRAGGADMAVYLPSSATVLRLHLCRSARGIHVKGEKADALGSAAGIQETERRGRCVVYAEADFLHILQRLFRSQDGELYSLRFGVACSVEPGAGGEPAVWWAPRAKRKRCC
jgi:hypothetical protein